MGKANRLSRRLDQQKGVENDRVSIKQELVRGVKILVEEEKLRGRIKKAWEKDKKVIKVVEELKKAEIRTLRDEEQSTEKEIVMKEGRI